VTTLPAMHLDQKALEQKNHDLAEKYKGKSKQQQHLLRQYQLLKRGQETPGLEMAADQNAEHFLRAAAVPGSLRRGGQYTHSRGSNGSGSGGEHSRAIQAWEQQSAGSRVGMQTSRAFAKHGIEDCVSLRYTDEFCRQRTRTKRSSDAFGPSSALSDDLR